jgi:cysteine sulfinate desulfinase/cysteine desulfurase-like protein
LNLYFRNLVGIIHAIRVDSLNNMPIPEMRAIAAEHGVLFLVDAQGAANDRGMNT